MKVRDRGFAMADALIALMIASLFFVAIIEAPQATIRLTLKEQRRLEATIIAQSLSFRPDVPNTGVVTLDGNRYYWEKSVDTEWADQDSGVRLIASEVSVWWSAKQQPESQVELRITRLEGSL